MCKTCATECRLDGSVPIPWHSQFGMWSAEPGPCWIQHLPTAGRQQAAKGEDALDELDIVRSPQW